MSQKFLVINCDETDVDDLRARLGGRSVISCDSIEEIRRYLPSPSAAVLVSQPASSSVASNSVASHSVHTTSGSNATGMSSVSGMSAAAPSMINGTANGEMNGENGHASDLDTLVKRFLDQQNGHAKTLASRVDILEQKIIEYSLNRNGQHRKETAAELGISRVTLYNKMKKFGLLD